MSASVLQLSVLPVRSVYNLRPDNSPRHDVYRITKRYRFSYQQHTAVYYGYMQHADACMNKQFLYAVTGVQDHFFSTNSVLGQPVLCFHRQNNSAL